jgi:hypothetical protein
MINFPTNSSMLIWYIIISVILLGSFIGIGYAYFKILKKHRWRASKKGEQPFKEIDTIGK